MDKKASLEEQLQDERAARELAERELAALKTEKRLLEYRVINAHRTLAHGLGRALIEARSLKGLATLPRKLRRLRLKQKAKRRERVANSFTQEAAELLSLVDPALNRAADDGVDSAVKWVTEQKAEPAAKGRALAELAYRTFDNGDVDAAADIGLKALEQSPEEHRLLGLAIALRKRGLVAVPAKLCATLRNAQTLSQPQEKLCDSMVEDGIVLETGEWGTGLSSGKTDRTGGKQFALLCPARWAALQEVSAAQRGAKALGLSVAMYGSDPGQAYDDFGIIHIFAEALNSACDQVVAAHKAGCKIALDLAVPPEASILHPKSELAAVERARIKGLANFVDLLIVRSRSAADYLESLNVDYKVARLDIEDETGEISQESIAATALEYGFDKDGPTIGCIATLDDDEGLISFFESFADLLKTGEAEQLLILGKGSGMSALARKSDHLGIADHLHFLGLPAPQRWPSLLTAMDVIAFPRATGETLGSEVPMIMTEAIRLGRPVAATHAAWKSQVSEKGNLPIVASTKEDWLDILAQEPKVAEGFGEGFKSGESIKSLYEALYKPF